MPPLLSVPKSNAAGITPNGLLPARIETVIPSKPKAGIPDCQREAIINTQTAPPIPASAPDSAMLVTIVRSASTPPYSAASGWRPLVTKS
jgi:hypothetical protein